MNDLSATDPAADLPAPQPGRFRPLRLGLVDMFLYDAQEFRFHDGRLLLRGDNGSGKSKVLALTLPLLLDADIRPNRMEPDGDPNKKMQWNLLLGDEHEERTGYTWVEFGRIDPETRLSEFVTLGLGLKAVRSRGIARQWWFITDRRIGGDLHLADRTRTVLTKDRLVDALDGRGDVFESNGRYRRAVDERLFGLHDRYDALLDLLVSLRQPQLSKRPDATLMNAALTEALPPLDPSLVASVAESFQSLDDDAAQVRRLAAETAAVSRFVEAHRRYARVATARAADAPRAANARFEDRTRVLRAAEEERDRAAAESAEVGERFRRSTEELARLTAERDALMQRSMSPEFAEFAASGEAVRAAQRHAEMASASAGRATAAIDEQRRRVTSARDTLASRELAVEQAAGEVREAAGRAGVGAELPTDATETERFRRDVGDAVERRGREVTHVTTLRVTRDSARAEVVNAQARVTEAEAELAQAEDEASEATARAEGEAEAWLTAVDGYLGSLLELSLEGSVPPVEEAAAWTLDPQGENPVVDWARTTRDALVPSFDAQVARAIAARAGAEARRLELSAEQEALEATGVVRPTPPPTRSSDRATLGGAAFWELVDVVDGADAREVAGIEAALAASGILDAWVTPSGELIAGDTVLRANPQGGRTLSARLAPVADAVVDVDTVAALLESVRLVDSGSLDALSQGAAVSLDGWFSVGPMVGSATVTEAVYLGQIAREAARERRLRDLRAELTDLDADIVRLDEDQKTLRQRRDRLQRESSAVPADRALRGAVAEAAGAARRRSEAAERLDSRRSVLAEKQERSDEADRALTEAVELYELPLDGLDDVRDAVRAIPALARTVVQSVTEVEDQRRRVDDESRALDTAERQGREAATAAEEARLALVAARSRYELLENTVGADLAEVERRLGEARSAVGAEERRHAKLIEAKGTAVAAVEGARVRVEAATGERDEATANRSDAIRAFQSFARTGLIHLAVESPDLPDLDSQWLPDPVTRLARRLLAELGEEARDVDFDAATNALRRAYDTLDGELSAEGRAASWEQQDSVAIVRIQRGNDRLEPAHLERLLADELALRRQLLSANERNIIETYLIDDVGGQLHERVVAAQQQVARMNDELEKRPTRSGLRLRIRWRPIDDELADAGRAVLQRDAAVWSEEERQSVGAFLRARLSAAREENPAGSWFEALSEALDYRSWNRFEVQLNQGTGWRPASGPASGGEKVLAASVPLFAAASSHYSTAGVAHAPRLVLLDEAFAGVDDRSRASYLGLLAEFDLDVVMTSEREWATYPEVPGIGIANLFRLPGINTVHVEHWEWDGVAPRQVAPGAWEHSAIEVVPPSRALDDSSTGLFDLDGAE